MIVSFDFIEIQVTKQILEHWFGKGQLQGVFQEFHISTCMNMVEKYDRSTCWPCLNPTGYVMALYSNMMGSELDQWFSVAINESRLFLGCIGSSTSMRITPL